jgi:hypothetical protein
MQNIPHAFRELSIIHLRWQNNCRALARAIGFAQQLVLLLFTRTVRLAQGPGIQLLLSNTIVWCEKCWELSAELLPFSLSAARLYEDIKSFTKELLEASSVAIATTIATSGFFGDQSSSSYQQWYSTACRIEDDLSDMLETSRRVAANYAQQWHRMQDELSSHVGNLHIHSSGNQVALELEWSFSPTDHERDRSPDTEAAPVWPAVSVRASTGLVPSPSSEP